MARIRSIHPGQWASGDFLECSPLARLLCIALRNHSDDHGVFRWKPTTIKAVCLPADNCDINVLLTELVDNRQITRYEIDGKEYGIVLDFEQWQRPKKPKYLYPLPPQYRTSTELVEKEEDTEAEISPQREEGGGRREEVGGSSVDKSLRDLSTAPRVVDNFVAHNSEGGQNQEKIEDVIVEAGPFSPERIAIVCRHIGKPEKFARGAIGALRDIALRHGGNDDIVNRTLDEAGAAEISEFYAWCVATIRQHCTALQNQKIEAEIAERMVEAQDQIELTDDDGLEIPGFLRRTA